MALSEPVDNQHKTEEEELHILGANYYKLPFCDEDMKQFGENMDGSGEDWVTNVLDCRFMSGKDDLLAPPSPSNSSGAHSPSSSSSSSSSGIEVNEHPYSLINDRPDTPLTAVKFDVFSNDYQLDSLDCNPTDIKEEFPQCPTGFDGSFSQSSATDDDSNFAFDASEFTAGLQAEERGGKSADIIDNAYQTKDRNLASAADAIGNGVITISRMDGKLHVKKEVENGGPMDFSFYRCSRTNVSGSALCETSCTPATSSSDALSSIFRLSDQPKALRLSRNTIQSSAAAKSNGLSSNQANEGVSRTKVAAKPHAHRTQIQIPTSALQTILTSGRLITKLQEDVEFLPTIKIKAEPCDSAQYVRICQPQTNAVLPPTPPSSTNSDNEMASSPTGAQTSISSNGQQNSNLHMVSSGCQISAQLLTSPQRLTQSHGPLQLTEEEKRTLLSEGYPVPDKLPLTKVEEKALKKIRRKIKNKISAQESRRKKKEYVEALERRMESYNQENGDLRRKLDSLEDSNQTLLGQLRSLQMLLAEKMAKPSRTVTTQTSSCLMVLVLCCAVLLGGWLPFLSPISGTCDLSPTSVGLFQENQKTLRSRVLLSYSEAAQLGQGYCEEGNACHELVTNEDAPEINEGELPGDVAEKVEGGGTYDEPPSGRVVMNDTKDQIGQIIANTMEPQDVAAVLASRKSTDRKVHMAVVEMVANDGRKYGVAAVTE